MMERDFMGLSSKEPLVMVKEETRNDESKDSGYPKGLGVPWLFSNKISTHRKLTQFKLEQEEEIRNDLVSSGYFPISIPDAFDPSQRHFVGEMQKSLNHGRQGGNHFPLTAYPMQHGMNSVNRPHDVKMFSVSNPEISVPLGDSFLKDHFTTFGQNLAATTVKQQLLGGISVTSQHLLLNSAGSVAGITEPWNKVKAPGTPPQLTIFYGGTVNVYDGISLEKAQAIMFLAGNGGSLASNAANLKPQVQTHFTKTEAADVDNVNWPISAPPSALSRPLSGSSHTGVQSWSGSTSTDEIVTAKNTQFATNPVNKVEPPQIIKAVGPIAANSMIPLAVPQARKASLARFLEKRKERLANAAPYNLGKNSTPESSVAILQMPL